MSFRPAAQDLYVNKLLTNLSIGFKNEDYIADRVFPTVFVPEQTGLFAKFDKSHWFRNDARLRGPGTVAHSSGWTVTTNSTYRAENFAIRKEIPWEVRDAAADPFDMDRDATAWAVDKLAMQREVAWATDFMTTSVWTTDKTGGTDFTKFSDYGASDPIGVLRDYKRVVRQLIARRPNVLVMGEICWDTLADHPDFIERIKGAASAGSPAIVTRQLVSSVLELDRIEVGSAMQTTTAEGVAEASVTYTDIIDDDMLLLYVTNAPSLMNPSAGYTFVWSDSVVGNSMQIIRKYDNREAMVDYVEAQSFYDQVKTAADAGLFLADAVD